VRRVLLLITIGSVFIAIGCQRDPGRDVKPMPDPLGKSAAPTPAPSEIIPLEKVPRSQAAAVSQRIANTEITITYSRPVARGRALFGKLVPYEQVWNPGADQATAIALTRDVHVNDRSVRAGEYSLWAIPRPDMWTVILQQRRGCVSHAVPRRSTRRLATRRPAGTGSAHGGVDVLLPECRRQGCGASPALGRSHGPALVPSAVTGGRAPLRSIRPAVSTRMLRVVTTERHSLFAVAHTHSARAVPLLPMCCQQRASEFACSPKRSESLRKAGAGDQT
jgi:hypothetical protein